MDLYCERCGPEFWAEPINALSNAAFLLAAFFSYRTAKRRGTLSGETRILIGLAATVGAGSFLFHTFATKWAMLLDLIPIFLLQLYFVWVYARSQMGSSRLLAGSLVAGLLATTLAGFLVKDALNGSLTYLPAWLLLAALGAYHIRQAKRGPWLLLIAATTFLLALVFRTIDQAVCATFPCGTHFLWHLLNGVVVFLVIQSIILNSPLAERSADSWN